MRNVGGVGFDSFVSQKTLSSREQEQDTTRQAAVGVLSLRRAPKLGKTAHVLRLDLLFV